MVTANRKPKPIAESKTFFSAEAFYRSEEGYIPMEEFAPKLLDAKTESDIEDICREYGFEHIEHSPFAVPAQYAMHNRGPWIFKLTDDFVPSYTSWMLQWLKTVAACKDLYFTCIPVVRGESEQSKTEDLFDMLFYAQRCHQQMVNEVNERYDWIQPWDIRNWQIKQSLRYVPDFPLIELFDDFQKTDGEELQRKYTVLFKRTAKKEEYKRHYWKLPAIASKARYSLWDYAKAHPTRESQHILKLNTTEIASMYLKILDEYLGKILLGVHLQLDSASRKSMHVASNIEAALYLWVFTQVQSEVKYKACKLCGKLFPLGSQTSKRYCGCHSSSEIQYFKNKIRKKEKEIEEQDEGARFEVVWRRNNSEVAHEGESNEEEAECC